LDIPPKITGYLFRSNCFESVSSKVSTSLSETVKIGKSKYEESTTAENEVHQVLGNVTSSAESTAVTAGETAKTVEDGIAQIEEIRSTNSSQIQEFSKKIESTEKDLFAKISTSLHCHEVIHHLSTRGGNMLRKFDFSPKF